LPTYLLKFLRQFADAVRLTFLIVLPMWLNTLATLLAIPQKLVEFLVFVHSSSQVGIDINPTGCLQKLIYGEGMTPPKDRSKNW
jgi:hypothetical protein